jgi:hypothetical protein
MKNLEAEICRLLEEEVRYCKRTMKHKKRKGRGYGYPMQTGYGGAEVGPVVNPNTGVEEIPVGEFAQYQQELIAGTPPANQVQDLTTVPYGEVANTVADLASEIPEIGPIISLAKEATNALLGLFYKPKATIEQRLRSEGVDVFADNVILTNSDYPDDDPKHFVILLPNGMYADAADQARYSALIYYQKVLGANAATWINRISQAERDYLFPPNDPQWATIFGQLAIVHSHANPYIVTAKFNK